MIDVLVELGFWFKPPFKGLHNQPASHHMDSLLNYLKLNQVYRAIDLLSSVIIVMPNTCFLFPSLSRTL